MSFLILEFAEPTVVSLEPRNPKYCGEKNILLLFAGHDFISNVDQLSLRLDDILKHGLFGKIVRDVVHCVGLI